jgi:glycerol-3-phosphate dehydrogenase (NAD(P)+)
VARVGVFGAGAAGTALAIHVARSGHDVSLWGSEFDARVLPGLRDERRHPALPDRVPSEVRVFGPEELPKAADGCELAVLGANSRGARSLARLVADDLPGEATLLSVGKGLERKTHARLSQVYGEELKPRSIVSIGGPMLAPELAEGFLTAVVFASDDPGALRRAAEAFHSDTYLVEVTDDVPGVELCGTAKNVAAIGAGIVEGLAQTLQRDLKNARAALFSQAVHEIAELVEAAGGRRETALGLAGMGDLYVTILGGRNRIYGEAVGLGGEPAAVLEDMTNRGLTVEGAESVEDVQHFSDELGLKLPLHQAVHRVLNDGAAPEHVLEAVR